MEKSRSGRGERIRNALWGLFAADSLAMPAHWYYSIANLRRDFPEGLGEYHEPPHPHPEAFMVGMTYRPDLETASRLGRPYDILHDHAYFYDASYSPLELSLSARESEHGNAVAAADERYHYHHGLRAGDNTLAAHLVRVLMRSVIANAGRYDGDSFLSAFVDYLTTPGLNRDPYTEIYLRRWFENFSRGVPPWACAETQRRVWSIGSHGGLMRALVVALTAESDYQALGAAVEHHNLTHRSENNVSALGVLVPLLRSLVHGDDLRTALAGAAATVRLPKVTGEELYAAYRDHGGPGGIPRDEMYRLHTEFSSERWDLAAFAAEFDNDAVVRRQFANACYPEHGLPLMLYHAWIAEGDTHTALRLSAEAGGDNVHRGMVLGLLMGAAGGVPELLRAGLRDHDAIAGEIEQFVTAIAG